MRKWYFLLFVSVTISSRSQQLQWAKQFSGNAPAGAVGTSVSLDAYNNVYTTGYFSGTVDFDPGPGVYYLSSIGNNVGVFVTKLDVAGNLIWAKQMAPLAQGGTSWALCLRVDDSANLYITGAFSDSVDFDPGTEVYALYGDKPCAFISKLDSSGNFIWAKQLELKSGTYGVTGYAIAIDNMQNVYTIGEFRGTTDFDPDTANFDLVPVNGNDIFVLKLDSLGNFCWAMQIAGTSNAYWSNSMGLALDNYYNLYITASFFGTRDFDPGPAVHNLTSNGSFDIFLCKLSKSGNFCWAKGIGGDQDDHASSITVYNESVYSTGSFNDSVDFDPGPGTNYLLASGAGDAYVSKLDTSGNFIWGKRLGGGSYYAGDGGSSIVATGKSVFLTGQFTGTADFDPGPANYDLVSAGGGDIFVCELDSLGDFVCAGGMGGSSIDNSLSIAITSESQICLTGFVMDTADMDSGPTVYNLVTDSNSCSAFVISLNSCSVLNNVKENSEYIASIFPNPSNGKFQVSLGGATFGKIIIYSTAGCVMEKKEIFTDAQLDITGYDKGMYLLEIINGSNRIRKKIIIE